MVEVEVRNFQSIEHVKFRISGFTALVGRSNIGKSAIKRAIHCALSAASGTDFVRHGLSCDRRSRGTKKCKCFSSVRIHTDALDLTWEKGDAVNRYLVLRAGEKETTVYDKVGQGTPDFLQPDFSPLKVGDKHKLVQVSDQFNPLFLLNQGGNTVADVLSDVAHLDQINRAINLVSRDRKADTATRKVREKDVLSLTKSLEAYEGLDAAIYDVVQIEDSHQAVQKAQDDLERLEGFLDKAQALGTSLRALRAALTPSLPDGESLEETARKAIQVKYFYETLSTKAKLLRSLRGVGDVALPDPDPMGASLGEAVRVESWLRQLRTFKSRLRRWKGLEVCQLSDLEPLGAAWDKGAEVDGFIRRLARLQATKKRAEALLLDVEAEEQSILKEIRELGVCPTCSQSFDADRCLHLGGA